MTDDAEVEILAIIPSRMQPYMKDLEAASPEKLKCVGTIEELIHSSPEKSYAVALIPATGFTSEQWWSVWGYVSAMEPRPSILVYALRSDFEMWASVLESGGYDVIVAPFTQQKLHTAIKAAIAEFIGKDDN